MNVVNPEQGVGINDLTLQNNIVYGWTQGISVNGSLQDGITGRNALNNVQVLNNDFQQATVTPVVVHRNGCQRRLGRPGRTTATTRWPPTPPRPLFPPGRDGH